MVNEAYHENMSAEKLDRLIEELNVVEERAGGNR